MNKLKYILLAASTLLLGACAKEFQEITEVPLKRCLQPMKLSAAVDRSSGVKTTFSWDVTADADIYKLEVINTADESVALSKDIEPGSVPFVTEELLPGYVYTFRVQGTSSKRESSAWAVYEKTFKTFVPKDPLNLSVTARGVDFITVTWSKLLDDYRDVSEIEATPVNGGETLSILTTPEVCEAAVATVTGLSASTQYEVSLIFKGAVRASVTAWTLPDYSAAQSAATAEELTQKIADGVTAIKIPYSADRITMGEVTLEHPLTLLGELGPNGEMPSLAGHFRLKAGATLLHLESLTFDSAGIQTAEGKAYGRLIELKEAAAGLTLSIINCNVLNYLNGLYYDNYDNGTITGVTLDGLVVSNTEANGGDFIDIRKASTYGPIVLRNSTLDTGGRDIFRIDANATLSSLEIANCTFHNMAASGNNVFYVRASVSDYKVTSCLFLEEDGRALIKNSSQCKIPTFTGNWYFDCGEDGGTFFNKIIPLADATKGDGGIVTNSPCADITRADYTLTNADLAEKKVGDPRWITTIGSDPEDLTLEVTAAPKVWNLTDATYFDRVASRDMVRDGIRFFVQSKPISFEADGFLFDAAATLEEGIPSDGAIGFKVNAPGSVIVSTGVATDENAFLVVSLDGKPAIGVPVKTTGATVVFDEIDSESMIYIYGNGPVKLKALEWSDELGGGDATPVALDTPAPVVSASSVNMGEGKTVTISWPAVDKAESYAITVNDEDKGSVTTTTWSVNADEIGPGTYTVGVKAVPAAKDKKHLESEVATVSFEVKEVLVPIKTHTTWGSDYFAELAEKYPGNVQVKADFVYKNLGYVNGSGGSGFKFSTSKVGGVDVYHCQLAGTGGIADGAVNKCGMQIDVASSGTLKVTARSGGDAARFLLFTNDADDSGHEVAGKADEPTVVTIAVSAPGVIGWCSKGSGINIYNVEWIPAE